MAIIIGPISLGGLSVTTVSLPSNKLRTLELRISDATATVSSPYTGQTQTQSWPGGDMWSGTVTLPPMAQADADQWIAFLMALRGMQNAFQLGDYLKRTPRGNPLGSPQVDNSQNGGNPAMSQQLGTNNWTPSSTGVLLAGDYIQIGYRLHRVLTDASSDSSGNALLNIWPSLREQPSNMTAVVTSNTVGLWRLASNQRTWSVDYTKLTRLSFPILEYR